jgi:predicted RND superfamily exporter protein
VKATIKKIDNQLEAMGYYIFHNKFKVLVGVLMLAIFLLSNLPKTTVDTSTEGFLRDDDPSIIEYNAFRDQYGRDEKLVVAIKTADIFSKASLEKLSKLHKELEADVPYLNDITSLINARNTQGDKDSLLVEDLFEHWPTSDAEFEAIKKTALNNPLYENIMISEDGTFTVIVLESNVYTSIGATTTEDEFGGFEEEESTEPKAFITDIENSEMVLAVNEILKKYNSDDFKIYFAGSPAVTAYLKKSMMGDMAKFSGLIILTIIVFLTLMFRRISGIILPLLVVILGVVSTIGLMSFTGTPIKVITQILPSLLLAVGMGAAIHVLAIFYKHFDEHHDKAEAIAHTLRHSGLAIIMTSLTTAAGIASFSISEVAPVGDLGVFGASGILLILLYALVLLPAILAILPVKYKPSKREGEHHDLMDKILHSTAHFSYNHAKKITGFSLAFMLIMIYFSSSIYYSHNPLEWFKKDHPIRVATETIDKEMKGSISLEIIVNTHKENGLYDYALLNEIDKLGQYTLALKNENYFVGKALSIVDVMKEIHKALNENRPEFYALAKDKNLMAQEILLFENSGTDDLEDFVDSRFSQARMTVKMPWIDAFHYHDVLAKVHHYTDEHFKGDTTVLVTGMIPLLDDTISSAIESSGTSYIIAFVVIMFMMMFLLSSVRLGLISMIPNLFPVFITLGIMVIFDFPLDMFTMLIGAIVIGMAVDDTVHFMHNFRRAHNQGATVKEAIDETLRGTGRAMTVTTIVLSIGFYVYMFASMSNLIAFGLITGTAIIAAVIADFVLAPALMTLYYRNEEKK